MSEPPLMNLELPGIKKTRSSKIHEIFDLGDNLLFVTTDRISAFECVMPNGIPLKGRATTTLSNFWFDGSQEIIENHRVTSSVDEYPEILQPYKEILEGRSMIVHKAHPLNIECVVRGYLFGSGWKEYREDGTVSGITLPKGLNKASELPEPIYTPSTNVLKGQDKNITFEETEQLVGPSVAKQVRDVSLQLYSWASELALKKGIIIADTKFVFGVLGEKVILIDEVLTPDTSRFWPLDRYVPGRSQPSFDKQYVRDYLTSLEWNKQPPPPKLPDYVVKKTSQKYTEVCQLLADHELK